jgi:uncharacterized membrane protein HdeD (DUF308 family)
MTTPTTRMPRSRGATIAIGVVVALAGLALLLWPGPTTLVLVSCLGIAIVAYGVYEFVNAVTGAGERSRLWGGIIGAVAVIGGVIVFATPLLSTVTVGLVIGWYWIVGGVIGIVGAIIEPGDRFIRLLVAVLSLLAGVVVIAQPGLALVTLVWFAGAWMLVVGIVMAAMAMFGRRSAG